MKKNLLWMLAVIFTCGLTAMTLVSCGDDDDDKSSGDVDTKIVGMRIAYAVEVLPGYSTNEDYTITVTWTDENGKDVTETITSEITKEVKFKYIDKVATFAVKATPKNSTKEEHDLVVDYAMLAKPMNAKGDVAGSEYTYNGKLDMKGKTGTAYREYTRSTKFKVAASGDRIVKVE